MKKFFISALFFLTSLQGVYAAKYHLIWQVNVDNFFEVDWVREILEEVDYDEEVDSNFEIIKDNSIVVVCGAEPDYLPYLDKLLQKGYKFGIIMLSDEHNFCMDHYENARFFLRNYWRKSFDKYENMMPLPLGYGREFWKDKKVNSYKHCSERSYIWAFAGQVTKSTRQSMHANMVQIPKGYVHTIEQWRASSSLPKTKYRELLQDAIFAPSPRGGWNLESFRVYEALESGAIPIVEKSPIDYFKLILGDYPFPSVNTWDEAPRIINDLLADPDRLEKLRVDCYDWWNNYKIKLKDKIKIFIDQKMEN